MRKEFVLDLDHCVTCEGDGGAFRSVICETTTFAWDLPGNWQWETVRSEMSFRLAERVFVGKGETAVEALSDLVPQLLRVGIAVRICQQCRFGVQHPFQGAEWYCLKHQAEAADDVASHGKGLVSDLAGIAWLRTAMCGTCKDFARARTYPGTAGSPTR